MSDGPLAAARRRWAAPASADEFEMARGGAGAEVLAERDDLAGGDVAQLHQGARAATFDVGRKLDDAARVDARFHKLGAKLVMRPSTLAPSS